MLDQEDIVIQASNPTASSLAIAAHTKPPPPTWWRRLRLVLVVASVCLLYIAVNPAMLALVRPIQVIYRDHNKYEQRIMLGTTTRQLGRAERMVRDMLVSDNLRAHDNVYIGVFAWRNRHVWLRRRHALRDALRLGEADVTFHWDGQQLQRLPARKQLY